MKYLETKNDNRGERYYPIDFSKATENSGEKEGQKENNKDVNGKMALPYTMDI